MTSTIVEIADQSRALGVRPAAIVHCTGSAGTHAGLVVGASVAMPETRIIGIDIDAEPQRMRSDVIAIASAAADLIGNRFDESDVEVVAGHAGPAYGVPHAATIRGHQARRRARSLASRSSLLRQGTGRVDRAGPRQSMASRHKCYFHPYRRRTRSVRLSGRARNLKRLTRIQGAADLAGDRRRGDRVRFAASLGPGCGLSRTVRSRLDAGLRGKTRAFETNELNPSNAPVDVRSETLLANVTGLKIAQECPQP